jgi:acyl carrier protein
MTPSTTDVRGFLLQHFSSTIIAAGLRPEDLDDSFDLLDAGVVDSLGVLEMIAAVQEHFKIFVDFEAMDPADLTVLGSFSRFVAEHATNSV